MPLGIASLREVSLSSSPSGGVFWEQLCPTTIHHVRGVAAQCVSRTSGEAPAEPRKTPLRSDAGSDANDGIRAVRSEWPDFRSCQ